MSSRIYVGEALPALEARPTSTPLSSPASAGNLPPEISEKELEQEFVRFGVLRNVWVRPRAASTCSVASSRLALSLSHDAAGGTQAPRLR